MSLQVEDEDDGGRLVTFDVLVTNDWGPRRENGKTRTLTTTHDWLYDEYLYRLSTRRFVRIRHRYNLSVSRTYKPTAKRFSDEEAAEWLLLGGFELPADIAHLARKFLFEDAPGSPNEVESCLDSPSDDLPEPNAAEPLLEPSDKLRGSYHDPDNYRRNVRLYELKKSGKTNAAILAIFFEEAPTAPFAPIQSGGALRNAIESIAEHHRWPQLKPKGGRPRSQNDDE